MFQARGCCPTHTHKDTPTQSSKPKIVCCGNIRLILVTSHYIVKRKLNKSHIYVYTSVNQGCYSCGPRAEKGFHPLIYRLCLKRALHTLAFLNLPHFCLFVCLFQFFYLQIVHLAQRVTAIQTFLFFVAT